MAELLVRVVDKVNVDDFYLNTKCTKRGDVIVVCPDGWLWGSQELANPEWRIVQVPDLMLEEAEALLAPERDVDPRHPSRTLQRRAFALNLDLPICAPMLTTVAGPVEIAASVIRAAKHARPAIEDPAVIGPTPGVL